MSNEKQTGLPVECKTVTDIVQHLEKVTGQRLNAVQVGKALQMLRLNSKFLRTLQTP